MTSFFALFSLFLKIRIFNRSFIAIFLSILILVSGFALLFPKTASSSAKVGIIFENSDQRLYQSCNNLLNLQETDFIRYYDEQLLRRDVMVGVLHCGYKIDLFADIPITVFETSGSMLTPVLDELVFSAWFEAHMLNTAPDLYGSEYSKLISNEIERLSLQNRPLAIDITVNTLASSVDGGTASLEPMLYSVFIPLVLLSAAFCALLSRTSEKDSLKLLAVNGTNRIKIASAFFFSQAAAFSLLPLAFDLLLSSNSSFSTTARFFTALLLSLLSAAVFCIFLILRPNTSVLFFCIMWAAVSMVFSGAFVSPALFGGFEPLKYLSPSWLLFWLMSALTAI